MAIRATRKARTASTSSGRKSKADGRISNVYAKKGLGGRTRSKKRTT